MNVCKDYADRISAYSKAIGEPQALADKRRQALDLIDDLDFPKIERSHYEDWLGLDPGAFDSKTVAETDLLPMVHKSGAYSRCLNDKVLDYHLPQDLADQGVVLSTFQEAWADHGDIIADHYMNEVVAYDQDKLAAHHTAFMNAGVLLYIPKHVVVEEPIQLHLVQDASQAKAFNAHVLVVVDENAQATLVEKTATEGSLPANANIVVEIVAKANARLHYSNIDDLAATTSAFVRRQAVLDDGAQVDWAIGSMNNGNVVLDAYTELRGKGAESDLKIVSITHGDQEQIINSHVLNVAPQTRGNIFQHGAVLDQSRLTFNAIGKIENGAKNADAQQESRLLMFSEGARGDANPILLIEEYEVAAGHAASVGQIDQEQLYYLMSRGIPRKEAMRLAIRGFLGPVIQAIPLESVRDDLVHNIERKLQTL